MFCSSPGQTYFISLFNGELRETLSLSHGQLGAIYSAATLCSAFLLLRTGSLLDRFSLHKSALCIAILLASAGLLLANSVHWLILFIALLLLRQLGQGLTSMTASTAMMRYLPEHKGKANAISNMGYSFSEAIMPTVVLFLIAAIGWQASWIFIGLGVVTIVLLLCLIVQRNARYTNHSIAAEKVNENHQLSSATTNPHQRQWTRAEVIRDPFFYLFIPGLMSNSMLYTGFMFHQIHLVEAKAWSLALWGSLYVLFSITSITTMLFIGSLADKFGAVRLAPWASLPVALGLLILSTGNDNWVAAAFMLLMGISTGSQGALSAPFYSERYGIKNFASIKSLGAFAMMLMTASSPIVLGWLIDKGVTIETLAAASAIYALAATLVSYCAYRVLAKRI